MQQRLMIHLDPVGYHHVRPPGRDLVEHGDIVRVDRELCVGEMAVGECLVGGARVDHHAHVRPVDALDRGEPVLVGAARDRAFAVRQRGRGERGDFLACGQDGDTADGDVEPAGFEVLLEGRPGSGHELGLDPEFAGELARHLHVCAAIAAVRLTERERLVVPGRAHSQRAGLADGIEDLPRRSGPG